MPLRHARKAARHGPSPAGKFDVQQAFGQIQFLIYVLGSDSGEERND